MLPFYSNVLDSRITNLSFHCIVHILLRNTSDFKRKIKRIFLRLILRLKTKLPFIGNRKRKNPVLSQNLILYPVANGLQ